MKVLVTAAAASDLEAIGDWIAKENTARAQSYVSELRAACDSLATMPRRYAVVPRYQRLLIRRCVYGDYLVFYRIAEDRIEILHVLHGARDYEPLLFPEE